MGGTAVVLAPVELFIVRIVAVDEGTRLCISGANLTNLMEPDSV